MLLDNPKLESYRIQTFAADHPDYAAARELAVADIEQMDRLHAQAVMAPQFILVEMEHGEIELIEDDEPWERLDIAVQRVARNVNAVVLLKRPHHIDLVRLGSTTPPERGSGPYCSLCPVNYQDAVILLDCTPLLGL